MALRRILSIMLGIMLMASMTVLAGCGGAEKAAEPAAVATAETVAIDETAELVEVTDDYVSSEFSKTWIINAVDLNEKLFVEKDDSFQLIDLRSADHYAAGHIEGAVNIPAETIVEEDALAKLDKDKTLIMIDYNGSIATSVHLFLTQLEYEVLTLRFGMSGWTTDPAIASPDGSPVWDGKSMGYPISKEEFTAEANFEVPVLNSGAKDARAAVINATKTYFANGGSTVMSADELKKIVDSKDPKYQIISLVSPEDYAKGHIEGAVLIPRAKVAKEGELKKIDPSKTIVLYCYQGHNSGMVQMFYKQLGYDAVSLQYGLSSWTSEKAPFGTVKTYDPAMVKNLPVAK